MKKLFALILAAAMALSLVACGGAGSSAPASAAGSQSAPVSASQADAEGTAASLPVPYPEKTVKIGVEIYDPTDVEVLAMQAYFQALKDEGLNVDFIYSEALASAEAELAFVDDCYNAGCQGILGYYNISQGEVVQKCVDYGMYYWGSAFDYEDVVEKFADNPYCLDIINNGDGDYDGGYALGEFFGKRGAKKVIYASGGADFGVTMFVNRREGFKAAAEEYGIEYVEVSGFPGDAFFADQNAALSEDVDGVAASFNGLDFWAQPIAAAGKTETCPLATIGTMNESYVGAMESGSVSFLFSGNIQRFGLAVALLVNAADGNAEVLQQDGRIGTYVSTRWIVDSAEKAKEYWEASQGTGIYNLADLESLMVNLNPDASSETLKALVEGGGLEDVAARRAAQA